MNNIYTCRVCKSRDIIELNFRFPRKFSPYLTRGENWKNYACKICNSISHFTEVDTDIVKYDDSSYRNRNDSKLTKPPISLPWSTITFIRSRHIFRLLNSTEEGFSLYKKQNLTILDYGGYNGFAAYGLNNFYNTESVIIADLDPNGLKIAASFGMNTIDLSKTSLAEIRDSSIDLCTAVHVLEHLENPHKNLIEINNLLSDDGLIYIEVPNVFGCSIGDPAHLISFHKIGLDKLLNETGFVLVKSGYIRTPIEAISYNYPHSSFNENIYIIAKKSPFADRLNKSEDTNLDKYIFKNTSIFKYIFIFKMIFYNILYNINTILNYIISLLKGFLKLLKALLQLILSAFISLTFIIINIMN